MSYKLNERCVTMLAGADLSSHQFRAVKLTGDSTVSPASVAGEVVFGINTDKVASGVAATIAIGGITQAELGGTVAAGAELAVNASGQLVTATTGQRIVAQAVQGGASGDIAPVSLDVSKAVA